MNAGRLLVIVIVFFGAVAMITGAGWTLPPVETVQTGYRGTGMVFVSSVGDAEAIAAANQAPAPSPPAPAAGPKASTVYQNVQVLGDLSVAQFSRLMTAMTAWVAPEQGCTYCHVGNNFASDGIYTKVVSRRMLQMTQHINSQWESHVAQTGVTCYTCHRGRNVPQHIWFDTPPDPGDARGFVGYRMGQNAPAPEIGMTSLPGDPFQRFLNSREGVNDIRVVAKTPLPMAGNQGGSIKDTEWTYALMMHMSQSLGVNCTYCHNTRSFMSWDQSLPTRASAWYGIRMVNNLNLNYLEPLGPQYPPIRLGATGDAPKANCATCHQGAWKPLLGVSMLEHFPSLKGPASGTLSSPQAAVQGSAEEPRIELTSSTSVAQ